MERKGRLAKLESLVAHNKGLDSDRLQALVFLLQARGEHYDYAFDVHHLRVFSLALESDLEFLSSQGISNQVTTSGISDLVAKLVRKTSTEQAEAAAAFLYFEQKGYSASEIEHSLNADEAVMNGAKRVRPFKHVVSLNSPTWFAN